MSDCLIFAALFALLRRAGPQLCRRPDRCGALRAALGGAETALLLFSSITYGMAMIALQNKRVKETLGWLAVTGLLGCGFLGLELKEFAHLIHDGAGPGRSAFLSSFFTLVGTHGLHVTCGVIWLVTLMVQVARAGPHRDQPRAG